MSSKHLCAFCGELFEPRHHRAIYCAPEHQIQARKLRQARGEAVVIALQAWRLARNAKGQSAKAIAARKVGKGAFAEFCSIVDGWNAEDLAAGRMSALKVIPLQKWLEGIPS